MESTDGWGPRDYALTDYVIGVSDKWRDLSDIKVETLYEDYCRLEWCEWETVCNQDPTTCVNRYHMRAQHAAHMLEGWNRESLQVSEIYHD